MQRRNVDLPEPDGPTSTSTCPLATSRVMPLSTLSAPKFLQTRFGLDHRQVVGGGHGIAAPPIICALASASSCLVVSLRDDAAGEVALQVVLADHQDAGDHQVPGRRDQQQRNRLEVASGDLAGGDAVQVEREGTAVTSDVVFSMLITSLPVGGMITRIACGSTVRRIVMRPRHAQRGRRLRLALPARN